MEMKSNPFRHSFLKAGVPNFDPVFSSGFPYSFFDGSPFAAMKNKPGINHPWVYAAISTIISSYVQCPLRLYSKRDPKRELIDDHPILSLLARPNPHLSGTNFLESIVWALDLPTPRSQGGQVFIWGADKENFRKGQLPEEIWIQGDNGVKPVLSAQKVLEGWKFDYQEGYSPYDYGRDMILDLQEVIRINNYNPYGNLWGVSPGYPLRVAIGQDSLALETNTALLTNGGMSRGTWTSKKPLSAQQFDEFKSSLAKLSGGAANSGKDRFVPWDMEYTPQQLSPEDMQYMEQLGWNRDTTMAAYKVSKFALQQYEDLNYATAKEAKRQLFDQAILPMNSLIMQELNGSWLQYVGKGDLVLTVDLSDVTALHDDMDARYKRAGILVDMGVPPVIALKMNAIRVDDLKPFAWLMQNQSPHQAFTSTSGSDDNDATPGKSLVEIKAIRNKAVLSAEEKLAISDDFIAKVMDVGEQPLAHAVRNFFNKQRNRNLDLVDYWAKVKSNAIPKLSDFQLDKKKENVTLREMFKPQYEEQAKWAKGYALMMIERGKSVSVDSTDEDIQNFITQRLLFIAEVNNTTFDGVEEKLGDIIAASIKAGDTRLETATKIREGLAEVYGNRISQSKTIARTETGTISNTVQYITAENQGMELKQWLSARDEKVRETHQMDNDMPPIPFNAKFLNGMDHPHDINGGASECINCRCNLMFTMRPQ